MHDARTLLQLGEDAVKRLARRGYTLDLQRLEDLLARRNNAVQEAESRRGESKQVAQQVQAAARSGQGTTELKANARELKEQIRRLEEDQQGLDAALHELLLEIPNLPSDDAPDGDSQDFAVEVRCVGTPPSPAFEPRDHVDLGEAIGILDMRRAAKLSGARFSVAVGAGARLERALAAFFLDLHAAHGYQECSLPYLVSQETMTRSGQLPKFEEDLFKTGTASRDLYLIPTAEVPLVNLHADEILDRADLPLAYTAWTPCFRSEAGSYGKDTRGILRLHQFSKVELVRVCRPEDSQSELELMLGHAEACLRELDLAYRVVVLAAGDMAFTAQITYDIEVWLPSQQRYREISSCSDCGTFQARRSGIRMRDDQGKRSPVATLNGSGLPIGRTLAAILEQHQQADGSVTMPPKLVPYLGFSRLAPDGTPES